MIGPDLEAADLESQVASWAVRATSQRTITIRATGETQPACLRQLFVLERTEGHWKITQHMYQMPEQSGGGCSGI
jgi:hypothetical protein